MSLVLKNNTQASGQQFFKGVRNFAAQNDFLGFVRQRPHSIPHPRLLKARSLTRRYSSLHKQNCNLASFSSQPSRSYYLWRTALCYPSLSPGDQLNDFPFDHSFGGFGIFDLFTDGDFIALFDQRINVITGGMIRDSAHWDRFFRIFVAACQCQLQDLCSFDRIFIEQFIEISQTIEQKASWYCALMLKYCSIIGVFLVFEA